MGKQVTKRCHWVAQSYLKAFAADGNRRRIWRFSRNDGEPELKRIDKVAVKFHLYAPVASDGRRDDALEKKLADLENWFGDPVWKAVCTDFPDFSWEPLRKMIALLAAVTWLRTPRQFEFWKNMHRQFADFFAQHDSLPDVVEIDDWRIELDHSSWPAYRDATEEDMKTAWNGWLGQSAEIARNVHENALGHPRERRTRLSLRLTIRLWWAIRWIPHRGLKHPEAMVTFPLSPTRVLIMDNRHSEPANQFYPLKHDPAATNMLIWRNAIEYMFSPRSPDEVCAEMIADAERMGFA